MDLSSLLIPQVLAAIGVAMLAFSFLLRSNDGNVDKPCVLIGLWLVLDIIIDYLTLGGNEYATAHQVALYYYLFAATSVLFLYITTSSSYQKSLRFMFLLISLMSVCTAMFRWFTQSRWFDGGEDVYYSYIPYIESAFVYSVTALDGLMIVLGVYSALATYNNTNTISRGRR